MSSLQGDSHLPRDSPQADQPVVSDHTGEIKNAKVSHGKAGSKTQVEIVQCLLNNTWSLQKEPKLRRCDEEKKNRRDTIYF